MQKHLSAVSQMVAKIVATRADYEVTRQAVNRKNPAEDTDWDRKVDALRYIHTRELACCCCRRCCWCCCGCGRAQVCVCLAAFSAWPTSAQSILSTQKKKLWSNPHTPTYDAASAR